jgi:hypothetical protein
MRVDVVIAPYTHAIRAGMRAYMHVTRRIHILYQDLLYILYSSYGSTRFIDHPTRRERKGERRKGTKGEEESLSVSVCMQVRREGNTGKRDTGRTESRE